MPIDATDLDRDPIRQLEAWLAEATNAGVALPNAFALATADGDGMPSVRFVLLHGLDADGLRFYTNRSSRKGRDLAVNPWAAAAFWWAALGRQARVTGPIRLLSEETMKNGAFDPDQLREAWRKEMKPPIAEQKERTS